ncbi:MAG: hydrolase [Candidatus Rokuibacteriota bacterium]|jgi:nicotinamidase-related amidase|nr:MAG: hydrolase [Candidatus Rokubacteria bacterium]
MAHPVLVVVDVQERLFNAMDAERRDDMVANVKILVSAARRLDVPVLVTEQYPKGLGRTLPELRSLLGDTPPFEKTAFSCCGADGFMDRIRALGADHVILTGIEAHVCVLLTALDLLTRGLRVSIVADAVCSRRPANLEIGLGQARQASAVVTATETVVFQLLGGADSDAFRELSKLLR